MRSEHLVDPELKPMLTMLPALEPTLDGVHRARATFAAMAANMPQAETPTIITETLSVPGPASAPPVRVLFYRPRDIHSPLPAILHLHGGGYVLGDPDMSDVPNRLLAAELGCAILSVDYRLAPETPHPGPVEDCYAVLAWLHDHATSLGIDPARIGVKGESAGGGLAASLAWLARDRSLPLAFQHLIFPMLDDRTGVTTEPNPYGGEFVWTAAQNSYGWSQLLASPPGAPDIPPYAAAARSTDLAGLPPAFIAAGALDLLLDENVDYAVRLSRAGVPIELHVYPGAPHGYQLAASARVSQDAERDSREALRRALSG